jgi:hypothetical protein
MDRKALHALALEALEAVAEEIDRQEFAGDEYDCLDDNDCVSDGGHLYKTSCGVTACVYCPKVVC